MWVLERIVLVVYAYGLARDRGEKYSVAIYEAVKYIRENVPAMRISETEVRRILAAWRPKRSPSCLVVRKSQTTECQRRLLRVQINDRHRPRIGRPRRPWRWRR